MAKETTRKINPLWGSVGLALAYWPFEAVVDTFLSGEGSIPGHLFAPDPNELWMRISISTLIISMGAYMHRAIRRQQRLIEQTLRLNRLLKFLSEVNQHIQRRRSPQKMYEEICTAAVDIGGFLFAWVGIAGAGKGEIKPVALAATDDACLQAMQQAFAGEGETCSLATQAMIEGKPARCNELVRADCMAAWREPLQRFGCRSMAVFPINILNKPSSVLTVYVGESGFFHDQETGILAEAADDISYALTQLEQETQRLQIEKKLKHVVEGTSAVAGKDFFRELVRHVVLALNIHIAFVAEYIADEKARSLAIFKDNGFEENFEWALHGTPCGLVAAGEIIVVQSKVQEKFPDDPWLCTVGVESYIGIPFTDPSGPVIGYLGIFDDKAMHNPEALLPVLKSFSARAGIELRRMQAEAVLKQRLEELERFHKATVQREFRIKDLRDENAILQQLLKGQEE